MKKTAIEEFQDAWSELTNALFKALRINKVADWLNEKLKKYG